VYLYLNFFARFGTAQFCRIFFTRYNTIEEFNIDSKAECDQLNLAHETKTNNRQCPLSSVQVKLVNLSELLSIEHV